MPAESCLTVYDPMDWSPPSSSVHGILQVQARKPEWVAFPSPGDLPNPGIEPVSLLPSALAGRFLTAEPPGKPLNGVVEIINYLKVFIV